MSDADPRFGGIERLYSADGLERLRRAKVCVVGIGGVGSWAVEALARSAVGQITLVDLDDICESNINRQLHSLEETVGQPKTTVMAERIKAINPRCDVRAVAEFFNESSAERILQSHFDWVIDAIDQTANKCLLIARCCQNKMPIIASGGAGGRKDPLKIQIVDLSQTKGDALLQQARKRLRDEHGFSRDPKTPFKVPCVFSSEPPVYPSNCKGGARINCDTGYGAASFVTGAFGLAAAGYVVSNIAQGSSHGTGPE
ncbi:MAG TPA: tRNA threonylcarbamoyladenosine dehydratase [Verrucomicrobiae bacterium]|jgi:tRNA A37 threonylcarbamoyladenosine dehydratase